MRMQSPRPAVLRHKTTCFYSTAGVLLKGNVYPVVLRTLNRFRDIRSEPSSFTTSSNLSSISSWLTNTKQFVKQNSRLLFRQHHSINIKDFRSSKINNHPVSTRGCHILAHLKRFLLKGQFEKKVKSSICFAISLVTRHNVCEYGHKLSTDKTPKLQQ